MFSLLRTPRAVAGILSFLLPGLGHLYGSRVALAAIWFAPFVLGLVARLPVLYMLLLSILSSWDAVRLDLPEGNAARRVLFVAAGICGFFFWSITLSPVIRPLEGQLHVQQSAQQLAKSVRACRAERGAYPSGPSQCPALRQARDPWGNSFRYELTQTGKPGFRLRSAGPDGQWGGGDDFVFRFR